MRVNNDRPQNMLMSGQDINLSTENAILMFSCHSRTTDGCNNCRIATVTHRSSPTSATRPCQDAGLEPDVTLFSANLESRGGIGARVAQSESHTRLRLACISGRETMLWYTELTQDLRRTSSHSPPPKTRIKTRALRGRAHPAARCAV